MANPKQRLLIIDGNALIHRSYHALPPLTTAKGEPVQAVFGFASTLLKAWKDLKPTHIVAAFDLKGPTFRHEAFKDYKATRVKAPDDLYAQIPRVQELVESFNIPVFTHQGCEADDVIGSIVKQEPGIEKIILTGDMDTMQLVDDHTKVYTLRKGLSDTILYDPKAVHERYNITPEQIIDYKALRGDPSDNIPGVKGIGEKTAADLLQQFGTLENMYVELADNTKKAQALKEGVRQKLMDHKTDAFLSKQLATIKCDVPLEFELDRAAVRHYNREQVARMFQELEFRSLIPKLPDVIEPVVAAGKSSSSRTKKSGEGKQAQLLLGVNVPIPNRPDQKYTLIDDDAKFEAFLTELKKQKCFAVDTETTGLNVWTCRILGLSFSWKAGEAYYVVSNTKRLKALRPILEDVKVEKVGHNMKFDAEVLRFCGIALKPLSFDTMIAAYLLNPGARQNKLDNIVLTEFGYEMMPITALIGKKGKSQLPLESVPVEAMAWYSGEDADFTWRLYQRLEPKLKEAGVRELFDTMEMPLVEVLMEMEITGVKIDADFLNEMSKKVTKDLRNIEKKIFELAGSKFNVNSPIQLKEILFDKLKIPTTGIGRTKTGVSTRAFELDKVADAHPIIPLIIQHRELAKLVSTYLDALPESINHKTGRVHTSFQQTIAATGRLASTDPNLQNIPIRTELGSEIRKAFIAERGFSLITADYSQIELRIIASMANDKRMIEAFMKGEDIHRRTAANIHNIPFDQVTPQQRRAAKATNFGIIYGLGYVGLAQSAGIPRAEAKEFIRKYFEIYTCIKKWLDETKELAHQQGYVETLFGRRRYFPEINSSNQLLISTAERAAINAPIQGTAADIMKLAMIKVCQELPKVSPKSRVILQVHDELVVEAPDKGCEEVSAFLKKTMESVFKLKIPVVVDVNSGKNWGAAK